MSTYHFNIKPCSSFLCKDAQEKINAFISEHFEQNPLLACLPHVTCSWQSNNISICFLCQPTKELEEPTHALYAAKQSLTLLGLHGLTKSFWCSKFLLDDSPLYMAEITLETEPLSEKTINNNKTLLTEFFRNCLTTPKLYLHSSKSQAFSTIQKITAAQSLLQQITHRFPKRCPSSLFKDLSKILTNTNEAFFEQRTSHHLVNITCSIAYIHKALLDAGAIFPQERHIHFRLIKAKLHYPFRKINVLGLIVGLSHLNSHEILDERQILNALQKLVSPIGIVIGSYYHHYSQSAFKIQYLEVEKKDASPFSAQEINLLKAHLSNKIKKRIATLAPPLFAFQNDEEILKNTKALVQELQNANDLPQVMCLLKKQDAEEIGFTVIAAQIHKKRSYTVEQKFQQLGLPGYLERQRIHHLTTSNGLNIETCVFYLSIPNESTLIRSDGAINFYAARQRVADILSQLLGEFRDFNGGLLLKQRESLFKLYDEFHTLSMHEFELLEEFFHAITPSENQCTISLDKLHHFLLILLQITKIPLKSKEDYLLKTDQTENHLFIILRSYDSSCKATAQQVFETFGLTFEKIARSSVTHDGSHYFGYILELDDENRLSQLETAFKNAMQEWQQKLLHAQILHLSFATLPTSLDPRLGYDDYSQIVLRLLFEGLMRLDQHGNPQPALAETVTISKNQKSYRFELRPSLWSDGTEVTAYDFEYSWKSILSIEPFHSSAGIFLPIKNVRAIQEGILSIDKVGIKALSKHLLEVSLEHPFPHFLQLTAHTLYSPVNHRIDTHSQWPLQEGNEFVCNGPFLLKKQDIKKRYELIANPNYWSASSIYLKKNIYFA